MCHENLAAGCSLIIRGVGAKLQNPNAVKIVETAISAIRTSHPDLPLVKSSQLQVKAFSKKATDALSTSCYVNIVPSSANESEPRIDLLDAWRMRLQEHDDTWEVRWTPARQGTDKRMMVKLPDIKKGAIDAENEQRKALKWLEENQIKVVSNFVSAGGLFITLASPAQVDDLLQTGSIRLSEHGAPFKVFKAAQIEIENALEVAITSVPTADYEGIEAQVLSWVETVCVDDEGNSTLAGYRVPSDDPDVFIFHLTSWAATKKTLGEESHESFRRFFNQFPDMQPPKLLHAVNTEGLWKKPTLKKFVSEGASMVTGAVSDLSLRLDRMEKTISENQAATQLQLAAVTASLDTVTTSVTSLANQVSVCQRALIGTISSTQRTNRISDLRSRKLEVYYRAVMSSDETEKQVLGKLWKDLEAEIAKEEEEMTRTTENAFTLLSSGAAPPTITLPNMSSNRPSPSNSSPAVPPGLPIPSGSRSSSASSSSATIRPASTPGGRTSNKRSRTEGPEGVSDQEKVRTVYPPSVNPLDATNGPSPVTSPTRRRLPKTSIFRGVLDTLKDLGGEDRSRYLFRSTKRPSGSCTPFLLFIVIILSLCHVASASYIPPSATARLSVFTLNAHGLGHAGKLHNVNKVILDRNPDVFVLNESMTQSKVRDSLPNSEYEIFEEPGVRNESGTARYKWGVVVGVRKDIQVSQRIECNSVALKGRMVALDLVLTAADGRAFNHRMIGAYAPWNPGVPELNSHFWPDITEFCASSNVPWTLAGDLNATISHGERASGGQENRTLYLRFLQSANGHDLWSRIPDRNRQEHWTCRANYQATEGNIIDRVATSNDSLVDGTISVAKSFNDFIPNTDHRAVVADITLHCRRPQDGRQGPKITPRRQHHTPRIKVPGKGESQKYQEFRDRVDLTLSAKGLFSSQAIDSADDFLLRYSELTDVIETSAKDVFGISSYAAKRRSLRVTNPTIRSLVKEMHAVGGAILFERSNRTAQVSTRAFVLHQSRLSAMSSGSFTTDSLLSLLIQERKELYKRLYSEKSVEIVRRAKEQDKWRISNALRGSTKRLVQTFQHTPLPLSVNALDDPDQLICDAEGVKTETAAYFSRLYDHSRIPSMPKPWLETPSVREVKERVLKDPFSWPRQASLDDFRSMLRRGNHRPAPGPDGWEKWVVKALSDRALSLVLDLHNYEVMTSSFPGNLKDMWLTMIHKRGSRTNLQNWRGLLISNFLANSPMSWLNYSLIHYSSEKRILPDTQVAAQPGVQTRDLMSFLAGIKTWALRNKTSVYAVKRDQMKGFDYLSPDGFYDALRSFGLPDSIRTLDEAAQTDTKCFIRTAYGVTLPITVSGVNKQGGALSPLKSTFTTSLGHYYLRDLLANDKDALVISSSTLQRGDPHCSGDLQPLRVSMVEATDDSFIFARSLPCLQKCTLAMERFQFAYGWLTQWSKSRAYAIAAGPSSSLPARVSFDSVSTEPGEDPLTIKTHTIDLRCDELDFLRTQVDDPNSRFEELKDFVESFQFPWVMGRLPLTLIRKIVAQNIVSRCRALLYLQPIKPADAEALDKIIIRRVHDLTGFPFRPNYDIATLPIALHGLGFPSISRINASIVLNGISRDLNHLIPAYRSMAAITLADWTCDKNGCQYPLDGVGLQRDMSLIKNIPSTWLFAHKTMRSIGLSFRRTDQSEILRGDVSLSHLASIAGHSAQEVPDRINGHRLRSLRAHGFKTLSQVGCWKFERDTGMIYPSVDLLMTTSRSAPLLRQLSDSLRPLRLEDVVHGSTDLAIPRVSRQRMAENFIAAAAHLQSDASGLQCGSMWASDGSMQPAGAGILDQKSVTAALVGSQSLALQVPGRNISILQGEVMGLIMGGVLAARPDPNSHDVPRPHVTLLTDHLNSTRTLGDHRTNVLRPSRVLAMNGRSYYRWMFDVVDRSGMTIKYTPGHSDSGSNESRLNAEADRLATSANRNRHLNGTLPSPIPTFFMNDYTFHHQTDGWIESDIGYYADLRMSQITQRDLAARKRLSMSTWAHSTIPPPEFPYTRAVSAYSATVQLYARSDQLPVADTLYRRNKLTSNLCRRGCLAVETPNHVFVECPVYDELRKSATRDLVERTSKALEDHSGGGPLDLGMVRKSAESLFLNSPVWPLGSSLYYLGQIPNVDTILKPVTSSISAVAKRKLEAHVAAEWHTTSIRLAGRIFGDYQRRMAQLNCPSKPSQPHPQTSTS